MITSKKKTVEIAIIIAGILFLGFKAVQFYSAKNRTAADVDIEVPINFDLEEARKNLSAAADSKKKSVDEEKHLRDILKRPEELTTLERKAVYGEVQETVEPGTEEKLSLEGIMFVGEKGNIAIVSGKVVSEGDIIKGYKILKIEPDRVVILRNGSQIELKR